MTIVVPGLAAEVAELSSNAYKAGQKFSTRERLLLASIKSYVDALPAGSITLSELSSGIAPSHVIKYAGSITAAGASATQTLTVTGVAATDIVMATVRSRAGAGVAYILRATPTLNTVTVVGSAAFDNGDLISYQVIRAAS
jgi:hypothetical protein